MQNICKQQYKALIRDVLENELSEQIAQDNQTNSIESKPIQRECERGLTEGKKCEEADGSKEEQQQDFLKGYAAYYPTLSILHYVRNDKIAVDSAGITFLFDPSHPENLQHVGLDIGRTMVAPAKVETEVGVVINRQAMGEGTVRAAALQAQSDSLDYVPTHHGRGQALFSGAEPSSSSQVVAGPEQARPVQQASPHRSREAQQGQQVQQEEQRLK